MNEIKLLTVEVSTLLENLESFKERPNKAKSKRLRLELGELKKKVTGYRSILLELDKEGY